MGQRALFLTGSPAKRRCMKLEQSNLFTGRSVWVGPSVYMCLKVRIGSSPLIRYCESQDDFITC